MIEILRDGTSLEWRTTIPPEHCKKFINFLQATRLPCSKGRQTKDGMKIRIAGGLRKIDVQEYMDMFFGGIEEFRVIDLGDLPTSN